VPCAFARLCGQTPVCVAVCLESKCARGCMARLFVCEQKRCVQGGLQKQHAACVMLNHAHVRCACADAGAKSSQALKNASAKGHVGVCDLLRRHGASASTGELQASRVRCASCHMMRAHTDLCVL